MSQKYYLAAAAVLLASAVACSEKSSSPAAPSSAPVPADAGAAADGSTLKVPAPAQSAPANGSALEQFETTLKVNAVTANFVATSQFAYRFQLLLNGQVVREFRTSSFTEWHVTGLDVNLTYGWRARAEQGQMFGPWSATWTFKTPDIPEGYIAGGEVYDPLWNGKTVGTVNGPAEFIPNTGVKLHDYVSNIEYPLPQTVTDGEFSMLVTNVAANTEGGKTKIMSMREGRSDITTNDRRFTIEKRGNPPGTVAWRIISHEDQIETQGAERMSVDFAGDKWYLWTARWGGNRFQLTIREDGAAGRVVYNFGKGYEGAYDPNPHMAYVGSPGRSWRPIGCDGPGNDRETGVAVGQAAAGLREQVDAAPANRRLRGPSPAICEIIAELPCSARSPACPGGFPAASKPFGRFGRYT